MNTKRITINSVTAILLIDEIKTLLSEIDSDEQTEKKIGIIIDELDNVKKYIEGVLNGEDY